MEPARDSVTAEAGPQQRRAPGRRVAAALLLVALAGAVVGWWGHPRLGEGSLVGVGDGVTWANDGVENTRMLVRGRRVATVSATFSIRNEGHLPFTVHGLDPADSDTWPSAQQQVTFLPGLPRDDERTAPVRQVTLDPGDEATVFWSLDMRCQPPLPEDSSGEMDSLRFRVSWWGIRATRELPLERPITFVGDSTSRAMPSDDCARG